MSNPHETDSTQPQNSWLKLILGLSVEIIVLIVVFFTPVRSWLGLDNSEAVFKQLQAWKTSLGSFAPLAYILTYTLATVFALPGTILTVSAGALFGALEGTVWTVIGATLGALGAFLSARFVAGDWARKQFEKGDRLRKLNQGIEDGAFWFVLSIRLAPIFPFNAVNYLFGLTSVRTTNYVWATFIGIMPGTFAYSWLGQEGISALTGSARWQLFAALGSLALLSAIPLVFKQFKPKDT